MGNIHILNLNSMIGYITYVYYSIILIDANYRAW